MSGLKTLFVQTTASADVVARTAEGKKLFELSLPKGGSVAFVTEGNVTVIPMPETEVQNG